MVEENLSATTMKIPDHVSNRKALYRKKRAGGTTGVAVKYFENEDWGHGRRGKV